MRLFYIAFGQSPHTIKWVSYFRDCGEQVMLVSFYPAEPIDGIDLRYINCSNRYSPFLKVGKVKRLIDEFKPDILHAHYASSCGMVAALSGFHPFVLSVWGDDILEFPNKSPIHRWAMAKTLWRADYLTATSMMLAHETGKLTAKKKEIRVIPFGVDLKKFPFRQRKQKETLTIGIVKYLSPKYGVEFLIRAFGSLSERYKNLKLVIVGDGPIRAQLQGLADKLGLGAKVVFAGSVPNERVPEFLADFDIFAMPSIGQGEIFGVAAVEAMATGLPVVATRVGGLPEVIKDGKTGKLIEPANIQQLSDALEYYIKSPEIRAEHGHNGRLRVEKCYDWQNNAAQMRALYQEIILSKTSPASGIK